MNGRTFLPIVAHIFTIFDHCCVAIVGGGVEASPNEFPWAVRLEGCGGSLLSDRYIITAAHCLHRYDHKSRAHKQAHPNNIWIYLGGHAGPHVQEPSGVYMSKIKDIKLPYTGRKLGKNYSSLHWDLALLEIDPINFTSTIKSIKIATVKPPIGETVTLAGWGFLNRSKPAHALHKIELQVIDDCDYYPFSTGRFCARHPNAENELKDACIGDSGSPLMVKQKENDQWSLTGVMTAGYTSVVEDCEKLGGYSLYADLSHPPIKSWLTKAVGEDIFQNEDDKEDEKHLE